MTAPLPAARPGDIVVTRLGARFLGRSYPVTLGRAGVARDKREGDMATPAGILRITGCLYRPDRVPAALVPRWAVPVRPGDLWCDDPASPDYNRQVRAPFAASHECLWRADPLYDLVLLTDWNRPRAVPGRGSAIFLHRWRGPAIPTAGCIAFAPRDLGRIARAAPPGTRIIVRG
jgi:L,D-peptidoglycan transpeptidase YkuD (ErfK/YbiS/YcfS/YnhG family)